MDSPFCRFSKGPRLGGGTYGEVYSVTTADFRQYAAKFLRERNDYQSRGLSSDALIEIDTLTRFRDTPEVIQLVDICNQNGQVILILEKMDNNLRTYAKETPFNRRFELVTSLLLTLSRIVTIFEILNIVHFDIKPENILVRTTVLDGKETTVFKISDFGLARQVFPYFTYPGDFFTRLYRPPEYTTNRPRTSFEASAGDIWTIGLTMADFLAGKLLIQGETPEQVLDNIRQWSRKDMTLEQFKDESLKGTISGRIDVYQLLKHNMKSEDFNRIDPSLIELISEMLQINPDHRISSIQILEKYDDTITAQDLLPYIPSEYPRRIPFTGSQSIPFKGIETITRLARDLNLGNIPALVAIEVYTRFLGALPSSEINNVPFRGLPEDTYPLACLQIGARLFGSFKTQQLIEVQKRYSPRHRTTTLGVATAEQDILRTINYMIYNLNLGPVIDRAYQQNRDLTKVSPINFMQSLSGWLSLGETKEPALSPFEIVQQLIDSKTFDQYEFEPSLQSMTIYPNNILTVTDTNGDKYYVIVEYRSRNNQIFPPKSR